MICKKSKKKVYPAPPLVAGYINPFLTIFFAHRAKKVVSRLWNTLERSKESLLPPSLVFAPPLVIAFGHHRRWCVAPLKVIAPPKVVASTKGGEVLKRCEKK